MELDEIKKMNLQVGERIEVTLQVIVGNENYKWDGRGYFERITENDRVYREGILYSSENGKVWEGYKKKETFCLDSHIKKIKRR